MFVFLSPACWSFRLSCWATRIQAARSKDSCFRASRAVSHSGSILLIIAIVGTTVAPWQLFFQQSNVIDKRITPRWLVYEKADTVIGSVVVVVGAAAIMMTTASAFGFTADFGKFTDALTVAQGLEPSHRILGGRRLRPAAFRCLDRRCLSRDPGHFLRLR